MTDIKYGDVIAYLYGRFPEAEAGFRDRARSLYGDGLPYILYGSVLVEYVDRLTDGIIRGGDQDAEKRLGEVWEVIERLSSSSDPDTVNLVKTGFLEGLSAGRYGPGHYAVQMGQATRSLVN